MRYDILHVASCAKEEITISIQISREDSEIKQILFTRPSLAPPRSWSVDWILLVFLRYTFWTVCSFIVLAAHEKFIVDEHRYR